MFQEQQVLFFNEPLVKIVFKQFININKNYTFLFFKDFINTKNTLHPKYFVQCEFSLSFILLICSLVTRLQKLKIITKIN